ncbi:hypothetical protein P186_2515 [Pyrobaculum ferrireducens]|uniref:Uncharacterized protein n=1 Tax=Pyrobaculum ferrireducens TaxID=1104324 RepID=G7VD22_9CREN|nr:hypothetical protein P186_2515 [Pyrobaculum ferrireducens]
MKRWSREERRMRLARGAPEASIRLEPTCADLGIPPEKNLKNKHSYRSEGARSSARWSALGRRPAYGS